MSTKFNWIGIKTLYQKEVMRFLKVYNQTLLAPIVNALLLLAIFSLAIGNRISSVEGIPFHSFMASGLIIMTVVQQSFANTSSTFIMGKVLGTIIDYLMPPITAGELVSCLVMAGLTRGLIVGFLVFSAVFLFVDVTIYNIGYMLLYIMMASVFLALLGILAGVFAESFDQMSAITSYVITPLAFLSGTFYSVKQLPELWYNITQFNPFFYMIDGFRYGMTGYSDGSISFGIIYLLTSIVILWITVHILIARGYRLKA
jgi:ABC-2 type transport system permease protein